MGRDDALLDLIGLVYEAAIEPGRWPAVLRDTATLVGAESGLLGVGSHRDPSSGMSIPITIEVDPVQQGRWVESYLDADVWWAAFSDRFDEGVLTGAQCVDPQTLRRTALYNDVLVHAGVEDGLFAGIARRPGADAIAALYRSRKRERFGAAEVEILSRLLPHLQRAARISDLLGLLEREREATRLADDSSGVGLVYLAENGRVLRANRRAERALAAAEFLAVRKGMLCAPTPKGNRALQAAIAGALRGGAPRAGAVVSIERAPGRIAAVLCVVPIPRETERPPLLDPSDPPRALIVFASADQGIAWRTREAARLLGLTPAEADQALALAGGQDLAEHARDRGIALGTARWRMKQILQKTGCRRQSDVVRLVLTTLGRLAAADPRD